MEVEILKPTTVVTGIMLVLAGLSLFLVNLGYLSWDTILQTFRFWPILLILLGLAIIFKNQLPSGISSSILLIIALFAFIGLISTPGRNFRLFNIHLGDHHNSNSGVQNFQVTKSKYSILNAGILDLKCGGLKLTLDGESTAWFDASFAKLKAIATESVNQKNLNISLNQEDVNFNLGHNWHEASWHLHLSPALAWDLNIDTGAVDAKLDLSNLTINNFELNTGAANIELLFGTKSVETEVNIEAGASSIKVKIPEEIGVKVEFDSALTSNNLNKLGWQHDENTYTSPGYEGKTHKINFQVETGASSFQIETFSTLQEV